MKKISLSLLSGLLLSTLTFPALAAKNIPAAAFFDAAICKPPYSSRHANDMYDAAEKLGKADKSSGAGVYHLPAPIKKDGFVAQDVFFSGSTIGVLVEGNVAEKLAKHYNLAPQKINIINMSGFSRQLPNCLDLGDHIPTRSLPYFKARLLLSTLLIPVTSPPAP